MKSSDTTKSANYPALWLSTFVVTLLAVGWIYLRLQVYPGTSPAMPISATIPLLFCVWTRRRWQLVVMGTLFSAVAVIRVKWMLPDASHAVALSTLEGNFVNILATGIIIHAILSLRDRLDTRAETILAQQQALAHTSAELEEQVLETKHQSETLSQQNRDLREANDRLESREGLLHVLLQSSRSPELGQKALAEVCRRALTFLGHPAEGLAVLELHGPESRLWAEAMTGGHAPFPLEWPLKNSLGAAVLGEDKTAYVWDIRERIDMTAPFTETSEIRSLLGTPLRVGGQHVGLVIASARTPTHWSQEQFRVIEWVAAQCGLIADGLRWQKVLLDRTRELEDANQAKDQFLAMLSHELRTPLTPVLAAAGALEADERLPVDVRADLGMIRRNVSIQSRLIDDLLDLTRIERGKLDLEKQVLNLPNLLRETAAIVTAELDAREQRLDFHLDDIDGCYVVGDGPRLQQVFWNLLKNAVKFSPPKGLIAVAGRLVSGSPIRVAIEIADHGVGLTDADLRRIFLPFEQVAREGRRRGADAGLGLGLAIAKAVVELHQGNIRAESMGLGRGARFTVELPVAVVAPEKSSLSRSPRSIPAPRETATRRLNLLLVEDHADTARIMARLLRNAGYMVEHAETAADALRQFQDKVFDLVISDLGLPDESGLELMKKIRAIRPDMPGICLSGYGMEEDLKSCQGAGFSEHLTKPVDLQRLRSSISRVMSGAQVAP